MKYIIWNVKRFDGDKYKILKPEKQMLEHIYAKGTSAYFGDDDGGIHVDKSVFLWLSYNTNSGFLSYSISRGIALVTSTYASYY